MMPLLAFIRRMLLPALSSAKNRRKIDGSHEVILQEQHLTRGTTHPEIRWDMQRSKVPRYVDIEDAPELADAAKV